MRIKGTSNPCCGLCGYAHENGEQNAIVCMLKNEETTAGASCKKFVYDIYKYTPRKKEDFTKFSKEDFEL